MAEKNKNIEPELAKFYWYLIKKRVKQVGYMYEGSCSIGNTLKNDPLSKFVCSKGTAVNGPPSLPSHLFPLIILTSPVCRYSRDRKSRKAIE